MSFLAAASRCAGLPDVHDEETRRKNMTAIRARNTRPEKIVRSALHNAGFRFRLHDRKLPGKPDLVFRKYKAVIFVNGCFWHGHGCRDFRWPETRRDYWADKISGNTARDRVNSEILISTGWRVALVWECALKGRWRRDPQLLFAELAAWLVSNQQLLNLRGDEPVISPA